MHLVVEIILAIVGFFLTVFWWSVTILPIFYGLHRAAYGIFRKRDLRLSALLPYLVAPVIWTALFIALTLMLAIFTPSIFDTWKSSLGFYWGQIIGMIISLYRSLNRNGRQSLRDSFIQTILSHMRDISKLSCKRKNATRYDERPLRLHV